MNQAAMVLRRNRSTRLQFQLRAAELVASRPYIHNVMANWRLAGLDMNNSLFIKALVLTRLPESELNLMRA